MPVSTMKNLFHLPNMSRNPSVHPANGQQSVSGSIGLSQSSMSMIANAAAVANNQQQQDNRSATLNGPLMGATSMADMKQTKLSTIVSKKANRAKEMFLQNLGKAERTKDELFEMYQANFYKQQSHALKLHKEIKNYIQCLKTMQEATRNLNICLQESHGKESPRHDLFCENISEIEQLYHQLSERIRTNVLANIEEYLGQFGDIREKIAKRGRKLIDYDSAKRSYELIQAANQKKPLRDETRLNKLREQYEQARHMYQNINNELHNELPALYESRIPYILLTLQTYCSTQINFHQTNGKLYASCHDAIDLLATLSSLAHQRNTKHNNSNSNNNNNNNNNNNGDNNNTVNTTTSNTNNNNNSNAIININGNNNNNANCVTAIDEAAYHNAKNQIKSESQQLNGAISYCQQQQQTLNSPPTSSEPALGHDAANRDQQADQPTSNNSDQQQQQVIADNAVNLVISTSTLVTAAAAAAAAPSNPNVADDCAAAVGAPEVPASAGQQQQAAADGAVVARADKTTRQQAEQAGLPKPQAIPPGATTTDLPDGVLYKVKTSYKYMAEDVDELCFEADEILHVIEYEDPLEQEEGWLMGVREINGQRGLFPANFTRII